MAIALDATGASFRIACACAGTLSVISASPTATVHGLAHGRGENRMAFLR
ncbi:MAG: hypothetical protein U0163_01855 [Gemmatimonadaceae bacterium]